MAHECGDRPSNVHAGRSFVIGGVTELSDLTNLIERVRAGQGAGEAMVEDVDVGGNPHLSDEQAESQSWQ
jgi:hypothetical protein